MFLLFIKYLTNTPDTVKVGVVFSAPMAQLLDHAQIIASRPDIGSLPSFRALNLSNLLAEAAALAKPVAEDPATWHLGGLNKQQFVHLGQLYRQKLLVCVQELKQQPNRDLCKAIIAELEKLTASLAIYEELASQPAAMMSIALEEDTQETNRTVQRLTEFFGAEKTQTDTDLTIEEPNWPIDRSFERYRQLFYPKSSRNRDNENLMLPRPSQSSQRTKIIVDAGAGRGNALAQLKKMSTNAFAIAISLDKLNEDNKNTIDATCYSPVPNGQKARQLFEILRGQVDQVFDTYGPATYASCGSVDESGKPISNPIQALIYLGLLLRQGGTANIIISLIKDVDIDQSPIGYASTRQQLIDFFESELGLKLTIARTWINSAVTPGGVCIDYCVNIHRENNAPACSKSLHNLFELAEQSLGVAKRIPKFNTWGNFSGGFTILGNQFVKQDSAVATTWADKLSGVHMDYQAAEGIGIRLQLQFDDAPSCGLFNYQFAEFFTTQPNPDWQLTANSATTSTIAYFDKSIDEKCIKAKFALPVGGWQCGYLGNTVLAPTSTVSYSYQSSDYDHCAQQAKQQLAEVLAIPGLDTIPTTDIVNRRYPLTLFSRSNVPVQALPETRRELDRLQNQYLRQY